MRYIETKPLSKENQKFIDMFFQENTFIKNGQYSRSEQTKPNQVVYYKSFIIMSEPTQKKFQLNCSIGGRENWSGSLKRGALTKISGRKIIDISRNKRFWDLLQRVKLGRNGCLFTFMTITFTWASLNDGVILDEHTYVSDLFIIRAK